MLIQRVITAVILLLVLLAALIFAQPWGFPLLALAFVAAGIWEWMRLLKLSGPLCIAIAAGASALMVALLWVVGLQSRLLGDGWAIAMLVWLAASGFLLAARQFPPVMPFRPAYAVAGVILPAACWFGLVSAYRRDGLVFMVSILALVWVADIAAYFSGKAFGRHKLAPQISPGKTIEGAVGGLVAVWLVALIASQVPQLSDTFFARLAAAWPVWIVALVLAVLTGLSIVGDLFESHLKRQAGVKDSSALLPGHGGVLDRIDALLPVVPTALLISHLW